MSTHWLHNLGKLSVLVALAVGSQACITAEVEQLGKRVSGQNLEFEGLGDAAPMVQEPVSQLREFDATIGDEMLEYIDYVGLNKMVLLPRTGVQRLDFIKSVRIGFSSGVEGDAAYTVFARYSRDVAQQNPDGSITLSIDDSFDHTDYVKRNAPLRIYLEYDPPAQDWALDIDLSFDVIFNYSV